MEAISASSLCFTYRHQPTIRDISFVIPSGEFVGIIGPNGSGKTTLLKLLSGLLKPYSGNAKVQGKDLSKISIVERAKIIAMVPQESQFAFPFTVKEVIMMGRYPHASGLKWESPEDLSACERAMKKLDLKDFECRMINELSGGEKQRVVIARALAQDPHVLLLDEPTSFLDLHHQVQICGIIKDLVREKSLTVLSAMHDLNLASCFCDRLMLLDKGRLHSFSKPSDILQKNTLREVFHTEVYVDSRGKIPYYLPIVDGYTNA